jgi:hypothetical protein
LSSSVLRSTSKNSSSGFCAFLTADVDAAAADSDAAAADEKSRLPSALDRDSITAAAVAASCSTTDRIRESRHGKSPIRGREEREEATEIPAAAAAAASDLRERGGDEKGLDATCERVFAWKSSASTRVGTDSVDPLLFPSAFMQLQVSILCRVAEEAEWELWDECMSNTDYKP